MAESPTLQSFLRLGTRPVPDFTFLDRAFKAITAETWKLVNEEVAHYAVKQVRWRSRRSGPTRLS